MDKLGDFVRRDATILDKRLEIICGRGLDILPDAIDDRRRELVDVLVVVDGVHARARDGMLKLCDGRRSGTDVKDKICRTCGPVLAESQGLRCPTRCCRTSARFESDRR